MGNGSEQVVIENREDGDSMMRLLDFILVRVKEDFVKVRVYCLSLEAYCLQCFPQFKHVIKIVIGSSAERVCIS